MCEGFLVGRSPGLSQCSLRRKISTTLWVMPIRCRRVYTLDIAIRTIQRAPRLSWRPRARFHRLYLCSRTRQIYLYLRILEDIPRSAFTQMHRMYSSLRDALHGID